jgi:uncharacterized protein
MNIRFDTLKIDKSDWKELPNGSLRVPVTMTRTGIFNYYDKNGNLTKEFRPESEVFKADSLDTAISLPVTDDHPTEMINPENAQSYTKGLTDPVIKQDGAFMKSFMTVYDKDLITKIKAGKRQVSLGYKVDLLDQPGEYKGERYDRVQTNIQYNHLAVVDVARGGHQVRIDGIDCFISADDEKKDSDNTKGEISGMAKLRLDSGNSSIEVEVPDSSVTVIAEKLRVDALEIKTTKEKLDALEKEKNALVSDKEQLQGKFDALQSEVSKIDSMIQESKRKALIEEVKPSMKDFKFDGLSINEIKIAYIKTKDSKFDGVDKSEDYINGRYDMAKEMVLTKPSVKEDFAAGSSKNKMDSKEPIGFGNISAIMKEVK